MYMSFVLFHLYEENSWAESILPSGIAVHFQFIPPILLPREAAAKKFPISFEWKIHWK
jgi:hypothetical protein